MISDFGLALAMLAQAAPATPPPPTLDEIRATARAEALRDGAPVFDQLVREADSVYHIVDALGRRQISLTMRARASQVPGICEREMLSIQMADAAAAGIAPRQPPRIRGIESERQFHLLRDAQDRPRWDVAGDALAIACAAPDEGGFDWFKARSAYEYRIGVLSLAEVDRALGDPGSRLIRVRCARAGRCRLDRAYMASQIDPTSSGDINDPQLRSTCGDGGHRCQSFMILDISICGSWDIEIESDWDDELHLRSATFVQRPGSMDHCGAPES